MRGQWRLGAGIALIASAGLAFLGPAVVRLSGMFEDSIPRILPAAALACLFAIGAFIATIERRADARSTLSGTFARTLSGASGFAILAGGVLVCLGGVQVFRTTSFQALTHSPTPGKDFDASVLVAIRFASVGFLLLAASQALAFACEWFGFKKDSWPEFDGQIPSGFPSGESIGVFLFAFSFIGSYLLGRHFMHVNAQPGPPQVSEIISTLHLMTTFVLLAGASLGLIGLSRLYSIILPDDRTPAPPA